MAYIIGIDGGGTKTTCLFSREDSALTHPQSDSLTLTGPGTNPHIIGFSEMQNRLEQLIKTGMEKFSVEPEEITSVCCGIAGTGREEEKRKALHGLKEIASRLQFSKDCTCSVHSDTYIALRGALSPDADHGILVISGTGSSTVGMTPGRKLYKSGGWGHLLGDEGSGYQIGLQALNSVTKAFDKRGPATTLTKMILEELNLSHPKQLVSYIYSGDLEKKDIARFARLAIEAAAAGDKAASIILQNAATELAIHVESLHQQSSFFNEKTPVTTTGSIFTYSTLLRHQFIKIISEKKLGIYQEAYRAPINGATIIAREFARKAKKAR